MKARSMTALLTMGLLLSACSTPAQESSSLETSSAISSISLSSESSQSESSSIVSSSEESSSSDDKTYFTVSIYQSYVGRPDALGRTGIRFDTSVKVEAGKPLYNNGEEGQQFYHAYLNPVYDAHGGAIFEGYLFYDEECTEWLGYGVPIESDSTFYYYLKG